MFRKLPQRTNLRTRWKIWGIVLGVLWTAGYALEAHPLLNPANNHYYELVVTPEPLNWFSAQATAELQTFNDAQGYLATITSQEELDFILDNVVPSNSDVELWLGGWRPATMPQAESNWQWITEESFDVTNWHSSHLEILNDDVGLIMLSDGTWDEMPQSSTNLNAYLIEYEANPINPIPIPRPIPPILPIPGMPCNERLQVQASYETKTLKINFELQSDEWVTLNSWLITHNGMSSIVSTDFITTPDQPLVLPLAHHVSPPLGVVGILTVLSNSTTGVVCSDYTTINTGQLYEIPEFPFLESMD